MIKRIQLKSNVFYEIIKYIVALLAVVLLGILLIRLQGQDVAAAGKAMVYGAFGNISRIGNTIRWVTPCLLAGISAAIAFRTGIWNMGVGGQLYMGAFAATYMALYFSMPKGIYAVACILVGIMAGMIWALVPALLKRFLNVSEMISTLMLNYVATLLTTYFTKIVNGISANDNSKAMATPLINDNARLTNLIPKTNASTGIFIAIAIVIAMYLIYRYTIVGYEMRQVGANIRFSRAGGVRTNSMYLSIFMVSGAIAGLAGAIEILGVYGKFTADFASNMGWDGIMIATIGMSDPLATGFVGILWGALKSGSLYMEAVTDTNRLTMEVIQASFVLFVTINYRKLFNRSKKTAQNPRKEA
jgi:simple sugar transport system permease protein